MKELFEDIIRRTHDLGDFEAFKLVVDNQGQAMVKTSSKDFSVSMSGKVKPNLKDFVDVPEEAGKTTIGFSRLGVLSGYLRSPVFNEEGSELNIGYMDNGTPREVIFKSSLGHHGTYRMMQPEIAKRKIRTFSLANGLSDDDFEIIFAPSEKFLSEFFHFSAIISKFNDSFSLSVEDNTLYMHLGEDDTIKIPVTETNIENMSASNSWPVKQFLNILKHVSKDEIDNVLIYVSNQNSLIDIHLETDQALYSYKLTAGN